MKKPVIVFIILSLVFAFGCKKPDPIRDDFNIGLPIETINPHPFYGDESELILPLIYSSLLEITPDNNIKMDLAKSLIINDKVITVELISIPFHNGTLLTAEDVKATYLKAMEGNNPYINMIEDIRVVNETTIQFELSQQFFPFIYALNKPIVPKNLIEMGHDFSLEPIGSGPFRFAGWNGNDLILQPNENYYGEKPKIKRLVLKGNTDYRKRLVELEVGRLDFAFDLPFELVTKINQDNGVALGNFIKNGHKIITINFDNNFLRDTQIRKLIAENLNLNNFFNLIKDDGEVMESIQKLGYIHGFELSMVIPDDDKLLQETGHEIKRQMELMGIELKVIPKNKEDFAQKLEGKKADMFFYITGKDLSMYSTILALIEDFYRITDNNIEDIVMKINNSKSLDEFHENMEELSNLLKEYIPLLKIYPNIRFFGYHGDIDGIKKSRSESIKDILINAYWSR